MPRRLVLAALVAACLAHPAPAAEPAAVAPAILGTWKGASTCVRAPGNEACRDEVVVYRFRPGPEGKVTLAASKVVNGDEVLMGELDGAWLPAERRWTAEFANERVRIVWTYEVHGPRLTGTCVDLDTRALRRTVSARRP